MRRKPEWLRISPPSGNRFTEIRSTLRERGLNTVCEEANCPNLGECWSGRNGPGTATFMRMSDRCSRGCNFCAVETGGMEELDPNGPRQIAEAVDNIGLDYVVLTSVDRDDLRDQGAGHFAETIRLIKQDDHEVYQTLSDLRHRGVDIVTLGQYLQPSKSHLEVSEYVHPDVFETWRRVAEEELSFLYCAAGPLVRSSYRAGELFVEAVKRDDLSPEKARTHARGCH